MKTSQKYLVFNKYNVIAFFALFGISFFSWAISSQYFTAVFIWDPSPYTKKEYLDIIYSFNNYPVDGYMLLQLIAPVFPAIIALPFLNAKKMFVYTYIREKSYFSTVIRTILKHLFIGCTVLFSAYLLFLLVGANLLPFKPETNPRELFSEITGKNFYNDHVILYFIMEGFLKYVVFTFVYGLFTIAISFLTTKTHLCVLIPVVYYNALAILIAVIESAFSINILFLSPSYTLMSNARPYINGFLILLPLLIPLVFSTYVILREMITKTQRTDAYAVI